MTEHGIRPTVEPAPEPTADRGRTRRARSAAPRGRGPPRHGPPPADGSSGGGRSLAVLLIVLGCVLAPVAGVSVWVHNQVSDTDRFVRTMAR